MFYNLGARSSWFCPVNFCFAFLLVLGTVPLRKHAYSNILKILSPKNENFQIKVFYSSAKNIDEAVLTSTYNLCFWAEKIKIMYTPVNPSFTI